mmetsp:Transcript_70267/g.154984  ORF Transcript_70267/g.154984 Transcript_70267/m.154984 type:complete len:96 (+) Transcript_70267:751-1038(+)
MVPQGFAEVLRGLSLPSPPSSACGPAVRPDVPVLFEHLQDSVVGHAMMRNCAQLSQKMILKRSFPSWMTPFTADRSAAKKHAERELKMEILRLLG